MKVDKLRKLSKEALADKNYRHKTREECLDNARKSFDRLPPLQQTKVQESWIDHLKKESPGDVDTPANVKAELENMKFYRYLAQTNLFFLCKLLERYSQVTERTHEEICNRFFVQKDPTFRRFEEFAVQYTDLKQRLLLTPRGGFKSSLDIADSVQWIVCFPEIAILILTGVLQLAKDFVSELRGHFLLEETGAPDPKNPKRAGFRPRNMMDKETGEWSQSLFQVLFIEHTSTEGEGKETEYQTPAGADEQREPTVRAASIEQALSGMHFGVLKMDDVVTNENSLTITRLEAVNKQISINNAMLHPYGFFDVIGTWYDENDYYGITIKQEEQFAKEQGMVGAIIGSVDSGRFESSVEFKVYLRAAWWPTEEAKKLGKIETEMVEADWELWFPERLSYKFLLQKKRTDALGFPIKYLNNPRTLHQVKFPRELLIRRTIPHQQLPPQGFVVTTVDTAYSVKSWADYTVILTALIYGGRFYIVNMVRGRFNEYQLPQIIASAAFKWKPKRIAIEDSMGVKWMGRELRREMDKLQIRIPVEYVSLGLGSKTKSKMIKAKPVVRLLGDDRMFFLNSCEGLQEIYTELEKFTGTTDDAHDDIVSALSLLADQFGAYADMEAKINFASGEYVANKLDKEWHDRIYGLGRYSVNLQDDNPVTAFQLEQASEQLMVERYIDPLSDAMMGTE